MDDLPERRGRRGLYDLITPASMPIAPAEPQPSKNLELINLFREQSRMAHSAAKEATLKGLLVALDLIDVLGERLRDGTLTGEEGRVLNTALKNQLALQKTLGVDGLLEPDDGGL